MQKLSSATSLVVSIGVKLSDFTTNVLYFILFQQESIQRAKEEDEKRKEISQKFQVKTFLHLVVDRLTSSKVKSLNWL